MNIVSCLIESVDGRRAVVSAEGAACPRCAAGKGCGAGLFVDSGNKSFEVQLPENGRFQAGDSLTLSLAPRRLLHAAILVYGYPLAGAILLPTAGLLFVRPVPDALAVCMALVGLTIGFMAGRRQLKRRGCARQFVPRVIINAE